MQRAFAKALRGCQFRIWSSHHHNHGLREESGGDDALESSSSSLLEEVLIKSQGYTRGIHVLLTYHRTACIPRQRGFQRSTLLRDQIRSNAGERG